MSGNPSIEEMAESGYLRGNHLLMMAWSFSRVSFWESRRSSCWMSLSVAPVPVAPSPPWMLPTALSVTEAGTCCDGPCS